MKLSFTYSFFLCPLSFFFFKCQITPLPLFCCDSYTPLSFFGHPSTIYSLLPLICKLTSTGFYPFISCPGVYGLSPVLCSSSLLPIQSLSFSLPSLNLNFTSALLLHSLPSHSDSSLETDLTSVSPSHCFFYFVFFNKSLCPRPILHAASSFSQSPIPTVLNIHFRSAVYLFYVKPLNS